MPKSVYFFLTHKATSFKVKTKKPVHVLKTKFKGLQGMV